MPGPEYDEEGRRERIRQLEEKYAELGADHLKAQAKQVEIEAARFRLQFPLPARNICPVCWYEHGVRSPLIRQPARPKMDAWRCSACGYEEENKA